MARSALAGDSLAIESGLRSVSRLSDAMRRVGRNRLALTGVAVIAFVVALAVISTFWTPYPVWQEGVGAPYAPPTTQHLLGVDPSGRDVLSRLMAGSVVSMQVGLGALVVVVLLGVTVGLISGFYGGVLDVALSFLVNVMYGIPTILPAIVLVLLLGRSTVPLILAIALSQWMGMARLARGQTLALREREYVLAARVLGTRSGLILWRHILPNMLGPVIVQCTFVIPQAILIEAFLSFLGLGVPPPTPTWGGMVADGYRSLEVAPLIVLAPAVSLCALLLAFHWVGDGLRDALDPRMRRVI